MGAAAYNRGSKVLSDQLDREQKLPPRPVSEPRQPPPPSKPEWSVGDWAFCTVHAVRGWYRVTAVRPRDGYFKISGVNTWNPPYNFRHVDGNSKPFEETR